ncbi:MAG: CoA transferase [Actinomycetota bacterium]|nr:CoA transferase [Actinomycetota bacterium]
MSFEPLAGIRVVDLTGSLAGPHCTEVLGALGADVVKVERPDGGDDTRSWGPPFWDGEGTLFLAANANKRSLALRISDPRGLEALLRLADRADVMIQSLRPGLAERSGFGAGAVRGRNPRLVYCSIGAFGATGPLRDAPGYDPLIQAASGIMSVTGEPGGGPVRVGASLVDYMTGMWAALGIVAALGERERTGHGATVDTSLYETALGLMSYHVTGFVATGASPGRLGTEFPLIVPYQAFATRDGHVMVAATNDRLFAGLCEALELGGVPEDARFATNPARVENRAALTALLAERFAAEPTSTWLDRLSRDAVPASPVQDVAAVVAHPQTAALAVIEPQIRALGHALSVDGERVGNRTRAPGLGAHTREVLLEAGYSSAEVDALMASGVAAIGNGPAR